MAFPSSPTNNQTTVINGITYTYNSTNATWTRQTTTGANVSAYYGTFSATLSAPTILQNGVRVYKYTAQSTAPSAPSPGDEWYQTTTDIIFKYVFDGSNYEWIDTSTPLYNTSASAVGSTIALRDTGGNLVATNFLGIASSAKYADLAEIYTSDADYEPGTVVVFGGEKEITVTDKDHDVRVAGAISTNPAYLMNSDCPGLSVALTGRVPVKVLGPIAKGDAVVTSNIVGVGQRIDYSRHLPGCILGKSLENIDTNEIKTIEIVIGRF
jgi:hypothetical protein